MTTLYKTLAAAILVIPALAMAAGHYTEEDFTFDISTELSKDLIVAGVNHLVDTDPRCATVDPTSVRRDFENSSPNDLHFLVTCGEKGATTEVVFTQFDAEEAIRHAAEQEKQQHH